MNTQTETTKVPYVMPLYDLTRADVSRVGAKAANLGELAHAGFPVPDGFTITTQAFDHFISVNALEEVQSPDLVAKAELPGDVQEALRSATTRLNGAPLAVRSSGVAEDLEGASFAGQYETILDVPSRLFSLRWAPDVPATMNARVHVISDDPAGGDRTMTVTGTAILPPVAAYAPGSFFRGMNAGETQHGALWLPNNGGSDLNWISQISVNSGATVTVDFSPELKKDEEDTRPGLLGSGGPDVFGYTWRDSDQPGGPAFNGFDISSIGTPITFTSSDHSNVGPFNLGFNFPFYGQSFSGVRVCTNGFLSFTDSVVVRDKGAGGQRRCSTPKRSKRLWSVMRWLER